MLWLVYRARMAGQLGKQITNVPIEKLVFGGQGLAHFEGKTFFVWGGLPGEQIDATVVRRRGGVSEAVVTHVDKPSPDRVEAREPHYLSCSPWQILSPAAEHDWKIKTAQEVFERIGHIEMPTLELVGPSELEGQYGYRNKMEYSFIAVPDPKRPGLSLAFFERATHQRQPIDGCALARPEIANAATKLTKWLEQQGVSAAQIKSLVLRSDGKRVVAGLFLMDEDFTRNNTPKNPTLDARLALKAVELSGMAIFYSDPRSPVSRVDAVISEAGSLELVQTVRGRALAYGLESFFQVNVPVFEQALERMAKFIQPEEPLIDLYGGVGSIGICVAQPTQQLTVVESNSEAIEFAERNAVAAGLKNATAFESVTERAVHLITPEATVILDPPRAGLHARVTQRLVAVRPKKIIYLSCNVSTQARDLALLKDHYRIVDAGLFNFFPRTPHVESLVVFERV